MPRKVKFPPSILWHKPSGRDRVRVDGVDVWLGPHDSDAARARYAEVVAELATHGGRLARPDPAGDPTVAELLARWDAHAQTKYAGKTELASFKQALEPLRRLFGHVRLSAFGPRSLKAYQRATAAGTWLTEAEKAIRAKTGRLTTRCRRVVNRHTTRIKTVFRWLESEELIPGGKLHALETVPGLAEADAADHEEVPPVPEEDLARTIPQLNPVVRAAAQVQLLTGARPGEVLSLRPCDLNRTGAIEVARGLTVPLGADVWAVVKIRGHKTAHRKQRRIILIGPKAQEILRPFLEGRAPDAYLFSPREAADAWLREHGRTIRHGHARMPGARYSVCSYGRAIDAGCRRAGVPCWNPHQLRHNAATRLTEQFGWEVARVLLGHKSVETTKLYAADTYREAAKASREAG